jgi:MFS family permease
MNRIFKKWSALPWIWSRMIDPALVPNLLAAPIRSAAELDASSLGWRMTFLAWLAQNMAIGLTFGVYGTLITSFERIYGVNRSVSTLGISLVLLAFALVGPVAGSLLHRISIKAAMITGACFSATGYGLVSSATSMTSVLLCYGLLIGPGAALLGGMLPSALVSNWFETGRGRALGIVNMPLLVAVAPVASSWILQQWGLATIFAVLAGLMLCLIPVLFLVIDHPDKKGLLPVGSHESDSASVRQPKHALVGYGSLVRRPIYWGIVLLGCVMAAGGTVMSIHIVPMAVGLGVDPGRAALLLASIGGLGILGSPLFGMITDRFGGVAALSFNAMLQAVLWSVMLVQPTFPVLLLITCGLGLTAGGMIASLSSTFSEYFGVSNFGRAYGMFALCSLPFTVGAPVLAGYLFSTQGSYQAAFGGQIVMFVMVAALGASFAWRKGLIRS